MIHSPRSWDQARDDLLVAAIGVAELLDQFVLLENGSQEEIGGADGEKGRQVHRHLWPERHYNDRAAVQHTPCVIQR